MNDRALIPEVLPAVRERKPALRADGSRPEVVDDQPRRHRVIVEEELLVVRRRIIVEAA